jgi:hypothetical protein
MRNDMKESFPAACLNTACLAHELPLD